VLDRLPLLVTRTAEATGPVSFAEAVEELAETSGRTIRYMRSSSERYAALLAEQDVPDAVVVRLRRVIDKLVDGRDARLTLGVEPERPYPTRRADD
jgi:uncharacterized protein YbjT (DUF2867 family)